MTNKMVNAIREKEGMHKKKRTQLQLLSTLVFICALVFHQFKRTGDVNKQTTESLHSAEMMRQLDANNSDSAVAIAVAKDAPAPAPVRATPAPKTITPAPTTAPTHAPTHAPTPAPTHSPTNSPTHAPTVPAPFPDADAGSGTPYASKVADKPVNEKIKEEMRGDNKNEVKEESKKVDQQEEQHKNKVKEDDKKKVAEDARIQNSQQQQQQQQQQNQRLNVILFYLDDWSAHDVGVLDEHKILKTPTFDHLAKEGMHFLYNAVTTSICWISRATLFTGKYVSNHGSTFLFRPRFAQLPEQWAKSWPYLLQQSGYWVGHIGKWQYRDIGGYRNRLFNYSKFFEGWIKTQNSAGEPSYIAEMAQEQILKFLKERPKDRPFAATVAFYPPKGISQLSMTKPEFAALYENVTHPEPPVSRAKAYSRLPPFLQNNETEARLRYLYRFVTDGTYQETVAAQYATISHIDNIVGQVLQELKAQGIYDKTLIIVTADNGEFNGARALADKWYPYQESIQVPLIIVDPRMPEDKIGTTSDAFTLNIDLAETILGAAGLDSPPEMDGRDIADLYLEKPKNSDPWRDEFYYEFPDVNGKIPASYALVRKDWKYIKWWMHNHEELFNLKDDPVEINNLVNKSKYAAIRDEMKHHLEVLRHDVFARSGTVPGTVCDMLWPPGVKYDKLPKCSPVFPDRCCATEEPKAG